MQQLYIMGTYPLIQKSVTFGAQGITRGLNMVRANGDKNNATKIIIK